MNNTTANHKLFIRTFGTFTVDDRKSFKGFYACLPYKTVEEREFVFLPVSSTDLIKQSRELLEELIKQDMGERYNSKQIHEAVMTWEDHRSPEALLYKDALSFSEEKQRCRTILTVQVMDLNDDTHMSRLRDELLSCLRNGKPIIKHQFPKNFSKDILHQLRAGQNSPFLEIIKTEGFDRNLIEAIMMEKIFEPYGRRFMQG